MGIKLHSDVSHFTFQPNDYLLHINGKFITSKKKCAIFTYFDANFRNRDAYNLKNIVSKARNIEESYKNEAFMRTLNEKIAHYNKKHAGRDEPIKPLVSFEYNAISFLFETAMGKPTADIASMAQADISTDMTGWTDKQKHHHLRQLLNKHGSGILFVETPELGSKRVILDDITLSEATICDPVDGSVRKVPVDELIVQTGNLFIQSHKTKKAVRFSDAATIDFNQHEPTTVISQVANRKTANAKPDRSVVSATKLTNEKRAAKQITIERLEKDLSTGKKITSSELRCALNDVTLAVLKSRDYTDRRAQECKIKLADIHRLPDIVNHPSLLICHGVLYASFLQTIDHFEAKQKNGEKFSLEEFQKELVEKVSANKNATELLQSDEESPEKAKNAHIRAFEEKYNIRLEDLAEHCLFTGRNVCVAVFKESE